MGDMSGEYAGHCHHGALCSQCWHQQTAHPHNAIHLIYGCDAGWTFCQIHKNDVEATYVRKMNIQLSGNSSGGDICGIVFCDKTAHFSVVFYCHQHKVHLCKDHVV